MESSNEVKVLLWHRSMNNIVCPQVLKFDENLENLRKVMFEVMIRYDGVGLAAPQVDANIAVAVACYGDWQRCMVNPVITQSSGESIMLEGCLSLPGATGSGAVMQNRGRVKRAQKVTVQYLDLKGAKITETYEDYQAHIVQHEIDHLNGRFVFERMGSLDRGLFMRRFYNFKRFHARKEEDVDLLAK